MQISTTPKRKVFRRRNVVFAILLVATTACAIAYFTLGKNGQDEIITTTTRPRNTVDYGPAKPEDKIAESSKDKAANDSGTPSPDASAPLIVNISNTSQETDEPKTVHIRAFTPTQTNGTCVASLTKGSYSVTRTAPLAIQANYAICQGFDIPRSEFPTSGTWSVKVTINADDSGGEGNATANLEVK